MKIGILGGSFDPPHQGHLTLARTVQRALGLDEIVFVPANRNPLKHRRVSPAQDRLRMVELMVDGEEGLAVSDIELTRGGPSYAVDTVEEMKLVCPGEYWFILGSDSLKDLADWKDPARLLHLCRLAVVSRADTAAESVVSSLDREYSRRIDIVPMPSVPMSSSKIREDVIRGMPVEHWLKPVVWEYIKKVGLYRK